MRKYDIFGRSRRLDPTRAALQGTIGVLGFFFTGELALHFLAKIYVIWLMARLGPDHLSAVTLSLVIVGIAYSLYIELGTGVTTLSAQRVGSADRAGVGQVIGQAVLLNVLMSFPIAIIGTWLAPQLLDLMGADPHVQSLGVPYLRWWLALLAFLPLSILFNASLRGVGDGPTATMVQGQQLITQLILMPIFVFGLGPIPALGASGTVLTIVIARLISLVIQVRALGKLDTLVKFDLNSFLPDRATLRSVIALSLPVTGQQLIRFGADALVVRLVAGFGVAAIAAYAISKRLLEFLETIAQGLGNAAFTVVGQNIGAGQGSRARRGTWIAALYSLVVNGLGILAMLLLAPVLISFFNTEPSVVAAGTDALRIVGISFAFTAVGLVLIRSFHGAGDTVSPVIIDVIALWGIQLVLALVLSAGSWGSRGVWLAIAIAHIARGLLLVFWFRRSSRMNLAFDGPLNEAVAPS